VDAEMVQAVKAYATELVQVTPSDAACAAGTSGMLYPDLDAPIAAVMPGPAVHREIAAALSPVMQRMI
ncbi:MAG: DUF6473 family protein, partial [Paracoccaceae bacterium]